MGNQSLRRSKRSPQTLKKAGTLIYSPGGGLAPKVKKNQEAVAAYALIRTDTVGLSLDKFFEDYELLPDVLGRGSYAEVRLAHLKGEDYENEADRKKVAVKIMRKSELDERDLEDVRREVEILKSLDHENIVKVFDYYEDHRFVYVVMEYLSGGELYRNIDQLEDFTEKDTRDIMLTLIHALLYCKDRGIAHRDIKPENILLRKRIFNKSKRQKGKHKKETHQLTSFKEAKRKYEIALADFGFAIQVGKKEGTANAMETQCGTPLFIAPEIIDKKKYNYKCDVWSLGVVCYMLLSGGNLPFPARSIDELYKNVLKGDWGFFPPQCWDKVSKYGKDFMKRLLVLNPSKRANYEELLHHPWFKDHSGKKEVRTDNIDFSALKRFNMRRKMLKALKAKQAADAFKDLMEDYEKLQETDMNLKKYLEVTSLNVFYKSPDLETDAEKSKAVELLNLAEKEEARIQSIKVDPTLIQDPSMLTSKYFIDVDELV